MTPGTIPSVANTRLRCFRIPDELYEQAQRVAEQRDEALSEEVRRALRRYVQRHSKKEDDE